jgi:hypothetical protein
MDPMAHIVFRISNGAALLEAIKDSPYGKLWNSPEMKPFLNNQSLEHALIKSMFLNQVKPAAMDEALELNRKILSMLKGEVIVGFELEKSGQYKHQDKDTEFFVLAEMDEADYKKIQELIQLESKVIGEKTISHRHTFQEVELIQNITIDTKDDVDEDADADADIDGDIDGDDKGEKSDWMAFYGNTFINASSRQWVEQCIVRLKKELPQKPTGPPTFQIWLPDGFINHLVKAKQENEEQRDSAAIFRALGLDMVGKVSFEWRMSPLCSEISLHIQNKGGKRGLWTVLNKDPVPRSLFLGYVPEDVLSYQVISLNIHAFWQEIPFMLDTFGPEASAQFRMGLTAASQMLQVDIERDIVANLDTVLISYSQLEGIQDESLYAWQLRNSMAMEKTLGKLFAEGAWLRRMMKDNFERLDLQEHIVYSFKIPQYQGPLNETSSNNLPVIKPVSYGITIVDGDLVFGRLNLIRSFIHGSRDNKTGQKFYQSPLFTQMIQRVPDNAVGYGFSDVTQWIKPAVNFFKTFGQEAQNQPLSDEDTETKSKGEKKPGKPPKPDPFDDFFKNLKYDRLPPPEFLRSFFGPWMSYYQFNEKEVIVKWEFHNPPLKVVQ